MGRKLLVPISEDRKKQLDSGNVSLLNTADAAHILDKQRKTIKEWIRRNKYGFGKIAIPLGGDYHFEYSELMENLRARKGTDPSIEREVERSVA